MSDARSLLTALVEEHDLMEHSDSSRKCSVQIFNDARAFLAAAPTSGLREARNTVLGGYLESTLDNAETAISLLQSELAEAFVSGGESALRLHAQEVCSFVADPLAGR